MVLVIALALVWSTNIADAAAPLSYKVSKSSVLYF